MPVFGSVTDVVLTPVLEIVVVVVMPFAGSVLVTGGPPETGLPWVCVTLPDAFVPPLPVFASPVFVLLPVVVPVPVVVPDPVDAVWPGSTGGVVERVVVVAPVASLCVRVV